MSQMMKPVMLIAGAALAVMSLSASARTETPTAAAETRQVSAPAQVTTSSAFPQKATVGGRAVQLNGAGTRFRAVFQVYRAALYTEKPVQQYGELNNAGEAKRIHMVMLREVNANELGGMFVRGIQENLDKASAAKLMPAMLRMSALFNEYKKLEAGDQVLLDWIPGKGTVVTVKGSIAGESIPEAQFYQSLAGIWLGPTPADWKLRDAMLGVKATTDTANRN